MDPFGPRPRPRWVWLIASVALAAGLLLLQGDSPRSDSARELRRDPPSVSANFEPTARTDSRALHGRVVGVDDGDSLTLLVDREPVRVRLAQIDAPEFGQPYGKRAKAALSALAFGKRARVDVIDTDRYGRMVGRVFIEDLEINREMVRSGHAWAYTTYSHSAEIVELEGRARAARVGLWALPNEQRDPPWIWRHARRQPMREPGSPACGTRTHCSEMANCAEARAYFERCDADSFDGDGDGQPCESLCAKFR